MGTRELKPPTGIVFKGLSSTSTGARNRRNATNIDTSILPGPGKRTPLILAGSDSDSENDIEAQNQENGLHEDVDVYSPYYSPLKVRKRMGGLLQMREPEDMDGGSWMRFWRSMCSPELLNFS